MEIKDAVLKRIYNLATSKKMMLNNVAVRSNLTPSTIYSLTNHNQRDVKISTINKICHGLNISLAQFFDDPLFENLD